MSAKDRTNSPSFCCQSLPLTSMSPMFNVDVLVVPKRVVPRLADLQPSEVTDLFLAVQHVGKVLEEVYKAKALTVSLQVSPGFKVLSPQVCLQSCKRSLLAPRIVFFVKHLICTHRPEGCCKPHIVTDEDVFGRIVGRRRGRSIGPSRPYTYHTPSPRRLRRR